MTYDPKEFWDRRLSEHFDLRGTGETGLSLAYNQACYALRRRVLDRALAGAAVDPRGLTVLDVGCGSGFFTGYYLERGARVTGLDIAPTSIERLRQRHPDARFVLGDVTETPLEESFDVVNAFDVLYHITDDAKWETAVRHLSRAVRPGGLLLLTDTFAASAGAASHNTPRGLDRYRTLIVPAGFEIRSIHPTHVLLNRHLGPWRWLNRWPGLLEAADRVLLALGLGANDPVVSKLMVARRARVA